ncbi:MAG: helix-turn-helix domain-containing protein [Firmicutes bacterium]|nr:helix-turn-helix domain-containing protein [Bacillota bacterium]
MGFSKRLKQLREELNISQATLGKDLGVPQSTIANWEIRRGEPNTEMLKVLATYFEVSLDYLLGYVDFVCCRFPLSEKE